MVADPVGISGFALYVPPYRVNLEDWCRWTGNPWDKIRNVVGHSFRMRGPEQNVYTMAATAVVRLIERCDVDPSRVRFLGLGTESSTDNSAGAIIVKGMVDDALKSRGLPPLSRSCEVPEFKHACLGGVYGMKAALRWLALDGEGNQAIVVSADIAEYARGSSGEPTQGAGAVAVLLEERPKLLEIDLRSSGSASDYRAVDFRKPLTRFNDAPRRRNGMIQDLPVFNGKYSTTCYVDETLNALDDMFQKLGVARRGFLDDTEAVFMHRPYKRMPESGLALGYLFALSHGDAADREELAAYCDAVDVSVGEVLAEMRSKPDVTRFVADGQLGRDAYPLSMLVLKAFRASAAYARAVTDKTRLGSELMMELGNLYTAAQPAWIAAGLEDAALNGTDLTGRTILTLGYGSGDAAEAMPMRVASGWRNAAAGIRFADSLDSAVDLSREQYESLHDTGELPGMREQPLVEFVVDRIGDRTEMDFEDTGIEYYRYTG